MTVIIPAALWNYTKNVSEIDVTGASVREGMVELDRRFPGIRHRVIDEQDQIRTHIKFFVGPTLCASIDTPVRGEDEVTIVCALSGG
jgi:molybdopterin synthase sulfur carrier subunit